MTPPSHPRVILAAGGTGGHLFPAVAIAHILKAHQLHPILMTDKRAERYLEASLPTHIVDIPTYKGGIMAILKFTFALGLNTLKLTGWYIRNRPALTIGFGGYPSVAAVIASILTRTPLVLHEQNAYMGRINRWLSPWARSILITLPLVPPQEKKYHSKIVWIGPILRPALMKLIRRPYKPPAPHGPIHLFIVGGSQGTLSFSTLLPQALGLLPSKMRARLHVVQQCRSELIPSTEEAYKTAGIKAHLRSFFTDIGPEMKSAHLIIARAGASTISEIAAIGRPAIFIPLPTAMDNHQRLNAQVVTRLKGGWIFDERKDAVSRLVTLLKNALSSSKELEKAAHTIHYLYKADADKNLMILINSILEINVKN